MNASVHAERLLGLVDETQAALPLETADWIRYVWHGRFGSMLIEVRGEEVWVNGQPVQPHRPSSGDEVEGAL